MDVETRRLELLEKASSEALSVFALKGVRPRTWLEQKKARQSVTLNLVVWGLLLLALVALILLRSPG